MAVRTPGPLLAFDTCYGACSVAVLGPDGLPLAAAWERMAQGHAERLMPMIAEVMAAAGTGFADLEAIAVTEGPGSFTGTRIGIAAARGLALARDLPVRGTTSLAIMAEQARARLGEVAAGRTLIVAVDARKGEIHVAAFPPPTEGAAQATHTPTNTFTQHCVEQPADQAGSPSASEPCEMVAVRSIAPEPSPLLLTAAAAAGSLGAGDVVAVGSGAAMLAEAAALALGRPIAVHLTDLEPDAAWLGRVALRDMAPPRPLYLRPADAKPSSAAPLTRSDGDPDPDPTANAHVTSSAASAARRS